MMRMLLVALPILLFAGQAAAQDDLADRPWVQACEDWRNAELSAEQRTKALDLLVQTLKGRDAHYILITFQSALRKDARAIDEVLPRYAELMQIVRSAKDHGAERRLGRFVDTLLWVEHLPDDVIAELETVWKSADLIFAGPKAAGVLLKFQPDREDLRQWFGEQFANEDRGVRMRAAGALGWTRKAGTPLVPQLLPLLQDDAPEVRVVAAISLWQMGHDPAELVPVLRRSLGERAEGANFEPGYMSEFRLSHKDRALLCLKNMGPQAQDAVPEVLQALSDVVPEYRMFAAEALGEMGVASPEVLKALEKAKSDPQIGVSVTATEAIRKLSEKK